MFEDTLPMQTATSRCPNCGTKLETHSLASQCHWCDAEFTRDAQGQVVSFRRIDPKLAAKAAYLPSPTHRGILVTLLAICALPFLAFASLIPVLGVPALATVSIAFWVKCANSRIGFGVAATLGWIIVTLIALLMIGVNSICLICR